MPPRPQMMSSENKTAPTSDTPLTDEEFDAWWPFSDDDLDDYEREIEESLRVDDWVLPPHLEEERRQARMRVRRILAERYPDGIPAGKAPEAGSPGQLDLDATAADDA